MKQRNVHGGHEFHFEGNLLVARSWGSWNLEAIELYQSQWRAELLKNGLKVWGACIDSTEWEIATPDAWEGIHLFVTWISNHGCRFNGVTYSKNMIASMSTQSVGKATENTEMVFKTFADHDECLVWCRAQAKAL